MGRPRTQTSDLIYCICQRVIHDRGGTFTQAYVREAFVKKLLYRRPILEARPPAEETITASMRQPQMADIFKNLIDATNAPYKGRSTIIAIDGSEFNIPVRTLRKGGSSGLFQQSTVKLHAAYSTADGMITAATVTTGKSHETKEAIDLIERTRRQRFVDGIDGVRAIAADKGYVDAKIIEHCEKNGIAVSIPAKGNSVSDDDTILHRHFKKWRTRSEEDKDVYAQRNLVEAAFSRIKRLGNENLRSRTLEAQRTELLCQVFVANVMHLIMEYVAGNIELDFLDERCRKILDPAREAVADEPRPDRSPKFRDGLTAA